MAPDASKVVFQVWFIPEHGIEQPPSMLAQVTGYEAAAQVARDYMNNDFHEPNDYGDMYAISRAALENFERNPRSTWAVAAPVHYGTLVIA